MPRARTAWSALFNRRRVCRWLGHAVGAVMSEEYGMGYNVLPDSVGRALQAAQRAVDAAPLSPAHNALARALFFRKESQAFRTAADLAIELNPMSASIFGHWAP